MPIQNSLTSATTTLPVNTIPETVTLPIDLFNKMIEGGYNLRKRSETTEEEKEIAKQRIKVLEAKEIALKNKCTKFESEKAEKEILIQLIDDDLQSSKRVLQCVCAIAGAILGGGLVLAFPPAGIAIALGGTGSMAAGAAIAGGVTGGCLVAPIIHEKTHKESIQQVKILRQKKKSLKRLNN